MTEVESGRALELTQRWLERMVIGLGLCPFAARPYEAGRVHFEVTDAQDDEGVYQAFLQLLDGLMQSGPEQQETALLIVPQSLPRFDHYLDLLAVLEQTIIEAGLDGEIQLASFHPRYCFDGVPEDDPANYTNRSPYPMFHLIREEGLARALAEYPNPERIPNRNVARLRTLGLEGITRLLADD